MSPNNPSTPNTPNLPRASHPPDREPAAWFTVLLWVLGLPGMLTLVGVVLVGTALGDRHGQLSRDDAYSLVPWLIVSAAFLVPWSICVNRRTKGKN
ncbi:hypothetical protein M8Z33_16970 [Streptomyces sp. ZAF1911]|uniref:hypothetical protein n=1 Tax=Streptomyces sp. ZAF1911 TaxID=2944129 RepID=UPI00237A9933|nr:hypothetical protein [Streptomyces sp. ZAF1911]MDD9378318.1 hypothetical protein [Streptomyces sp. ZAF1911]